MSVSSRDRKSVIYAEVERLRSLLDREAQRNVALLAEKAELRAQLEARTAEVEAFLSAKADAASQPRPAAAQPVTPFRARNALAKRLAITCKASVKWVDGVGFQQYVRGEWLPIPTHLIEYASKNLGTEVQA